MGYGIKASHSFSDRLIRANIGNLTNDNLLIAICSDSPSSADKNCLMQGIHGDDRKRIGAVAQIIRDYPEIFLSENCSLLEIGRIKKLMIKLPAEIKCDVFRRLGGHI